MHADKHSPRLFISGFRNGIQNASSTFLLSLRSISQNSAHDICAVFIVVIVKSLFPQSRYQTAASLISQVLFHTRTGTSPVSRAYEACLSKANGRYAVVAHIATLQFPLPLITSRLALFMRILISKSKKKEIILDYAQ